MQRGDLSFRMFDSVIEMEVVVRQRSCNIAGLSANGRFKSVFWKRGRKFFYIDV
jgi:hypothetical protein